MQSMLTESQKIEAKNKAILFLEKSIYELCIQLGVDDSELNGSYEIPVESTDPSHAAYNSLVKMHGILENLLNEE